MFYIFYSSGKMFPIFLYHIEKKVICDIRIANLYFPSIYVFSSICFSGKRDFLVKEVSIDNIPLLYYNEVNPLLNRVGCYYEENIFSKEKKEEIELKMDKYEFLDYIIREFYIDRYDLGEFLVIYKKRNNLYSLFKFLSNLDMRYFIENYLIKYQKGLITYAGFSLLWNIFGKELFRYYKFKLYEVYRIKIIKLKEERDIRNINLEVREISLKDLEFSMIFYFTSNRSFRLNRIGFRFLNREDENLNFWRSDIYNV